MDKVLGNLEILSQAVANQNQDVVAISNACSASADRCAQLADQITSMSIPYHSRHQNLQTMVNASLRDLDQCMSLMYTELNTKIDGNDNHINTDGGHPKIDATIDIIEKALADFSSRQADAERQICEVASCPTPKDRDHDSPNTSMPTGAKAPRADRSSLHEQACKLIILGFSRKMLVADLTKIGEACRDTFAPTGDAGKLVARAYDLSQHITLIFETPTAAGNFLDNFNVKGQDWQQPGSLHEGSKITLRLRRDLDLTSRQLFLSSGRGRKIITDVVRSRGLEVGSTGLGGWVYILRAAHDPVPVASVQVESSGMVSATLESDALLEFGIASRAAAIAAAAQVQLRRPFRG